MKQLYFWLRKSQKGPKEGTFRWHDRNQTTNLELNPGSLSCGFDDYPRATHPSNDEYHLDLRCWMAMSASVLVELAQIAEDEAFLPAIQKEAEMLSDVQSLDELHWSDTVQRYCDYGLHRWEGGVGWN
jgi:mannosyl-oligosaccharide glucosidase